jgi:thiamine pyrophosphate-dependent acetolactate synthase large subunit-like protein
VASLADLPRFPGDVLYAKIPGEEQVDWSMSGRRSQCAPLGDPERVDALILALAKAKKPVIISGSGVIWSRAWNEMQGSRTRGESLLHDATRRGVVPDDHPLSYLLMRSTAFKDADLIIVLGTRNELHHQHAAPPRFNAATPDRRIDIDANESPPRTRKVDIGIVGDCRWCSIRS